MTVTDLIKALQGKEYGGVTKEHREVFMYVRNNDGSETCLMLGGESRIEVTGGGDGVCGASLELTIINPVSKIIEVKG